MLKSAFFSFECPVGFFFSKHRLGQLSFTHLEFLVVKAYRVDIIDELFFFSQHVLFVLLLAEDHHTGLCRTDSGGDRLGQGPAIQR